MPLPHPHNHISINNGQASPQDLLPRWLACQSELLGSSGDLSPLSSSLLLSQSLTLVSTSSHLPLHPGISLFYILEIRPHFNHLIIFPMIARPALRRNVYLCVCVWADQVLSSTIRHLLKSRPPYATFQMRWETTFSSKAHVLSWRTIVHFSFSSTSDLLLSPAPVFETVLMPLRVHGTSHATPSEHELRHFVCRNNSVNGWKRRFRYFPMFTNRSPSSWQSLCEPNVALSNAKQRLLPVFVTELQIVFIYAAHHWKQLPSFHMASQVIRWRKRRGV